MRKYRFLKKLMDSHAVGAYAHHEEARPRRFLRYALPLSVVVFILGSIAYLDTWLSNRPGSRQALLDRELSWFASLREGMRENPWATADGSARGFLLSATLNLDPALRSRLDRLLMLLPEDLQRSLVLLFQSVELTPAQSARIAALLDLILQSKEPARIVAVLRPFFKVVVKGGPLPPAVEALIQKQAQAAASGTKPGGPKVALSPEDQAREDLLKLLLETEPDRLIELLNTIASLAPHLSSQVAAIFAQLASGDTEKLTDLINRLTTGQMAHVVNLLSMLPPPLVIVVVDRFHQSSVEEVVRASQILEKLPPPAISELMRIMQDWKRPNFYGALDMVEDFTVPQIWKFIEIALNTSPSTLERSYEVMSGLGIATQKHVVDVLSGVNGDKVSVFNQVAGKIGQQPVKDIVDLLFEVRSVPIQEKALDIWHNLDNSKRIEDSVDILKSINPTAFKQTVNLVHELDGDVQKKAVEVLKRVENKDGETKVKRIESLAQRFTDVRALPRKPDQNFEVKTPVAVAGVRGKGDDGNRSKSSGGDGPGGKNALAAAVVSSVVLDNKALNQGVSVMLHVTTENTVRAVRTMTRLDVGERAAAVDTLDSVRIPHLNAAVVVADNGSDVVLKESVKLTESFKAKMPQGEFRKNTERAINVASKVGTDNTTLERGVKALNNESLITTRRTLKQVDGQDQIFKDKLITGISRTYHELDDKNQEKFAAVLSGSEGIFVGASANKSTAREIPQDRKLVRIEQYMGERESRPDAYQRRVDVLVERPVLVPQKKEQNFEVRFPVDVTGLRNKGGVRVVESPHEQAAGE